jgi:chromosome segregation ATPase
MERFNLSLFVLIFCVFSSWPSLANETKSINDVPKQHWAHGAVREVVEDYKIMQGDPSGKFRGGSPMTRYEFAKVVSNLAQYYNKEFTADREDLASLVHVMELFQTELKVLEERNSALSGKIENLNANITSLQADRAQLAAEIESIKTDTQNTEKKLDERGFIVDTVVKGSVNDMKKMAKALKKVKSLNSNGEEATVNQEHETEVLQEVQGELQGSLMPAPEQENVTINGTEELIREIEHTLHD